MKLLVVDASALVEYLLRTDTGSKISDVIEAPDVYLHIPTLCDIEIASVLRKLTRSGVLSESRAEEALADLIDLPLTRHTHEHLLFRAFALRENFSAYDATYVALAEAMGAYLLTSDKPLAAAAVAIDIKVMEVPVRKALEFV